MNLLNILEFVQSLSKMDKKTLVGKTLKATEELGELSSYVLPYEQEYATTHRFPDKEKILEEACDLTLCALSVPMSMGFSIEDITDMLEKKTNKWANLQAAVTKGQFPLPFEIHITVKPGDNQKFINTCNLLKVKPIVLDLQKIPEGDIMSSSIIHTDNRGAFDEMKRISSGLIAAGFEIVREKIETCDLHPGVPSTVSGVEYSEGCYLECHFNVLVEHDGDNHMLAELARRHSLFLSRNTSKINVQIATVRCHGITLEDFIEIECEVEKTIWDNGLIILDQRREYAIYDSNEAHDDKWVEGHGY